MTATDRRLCISVITHYHIPSLPWLFLVWESYSLCAMVALRAMRAACVRLGFTDNKRAKGTEPYEQWRSLVEMWMLIPEAYHIM